MARISKRKYPILFEFVERKFPDPSSIDEDFVLFFEEIKQFKKFDINYCANSFMLDAVKNAHKIASLNTLNDLNHGLQIYLLDHFMCFFWVSDGFVRALMTEGKKRSISTMTIDLSNNSLTNNPSAFLSETWKDVWYKSFLAAALFKQFSEIKVKKIPPKKLVKNFHCKYKSDLSLPINLLDVNWYTQSIKNHPFVVRGHWRLQPHGKGMKRRKLKWIDPFMKQGYTKGAYKDN